MIRTNESSMAASDWVARRLADEGMVQVGVIIAFGPGGTNARLAKRRGHSIRFKDASGRIPHHAVKRIRPSLLSLFVPDPGNILFEYRFPDRGGNFVKARITFKMRDGGKLKSKERMAIQNP